MVASPGPLRFDMTATAFATGELARISSLIAIR